MSKLGNVVMISAANLVAATNIRHDVARDGIESMKASIVATGVLQNLIAAPRKTDGKFAVFAGGTRLLAIQELVSEGKLAAEFEVPVLVYGDIDPDSADAIAIAMSENLIRTQMDFVDECAAMAQLAAARKSEDEIAAIFGYRPKTVVERLLISRLIPDALRLLRSKSRGVAWARALTIADQSMQRQICDEIAANPAAWETAEEIKAFLTRSTVPANKAIFDLSRYKGQIVSDLFDGDKLGSIDEFWRLQNEAIEDLKAEIEAEGFAGVEVLREAFPAWQYDDEVDVAKARAFIEVMPDGTVTVIRNKTPLAQLGQQIEAIDADDAGGSHGFDEIAASEVRATPSICDYAAAQRTAMVQASLSGDFRRSLEYTVIAMIGHRSASFAAQPYSFAGNALMRSGPAFAATFATAESIGGKMPADVSTPEARERGIVAMVQSMDDAELQMLFSQLVSQRAGQQRRRGADENPDSLMNVFGAAIDVRAWWTPDEQFFSLMSSEDLRRLATVLLVSPDAQANRFASAQKKDLVRALTSNFKEAREGVLTGEVAAALNAWVPGVMTFPARIRKAADTAPLVADTEMDIDALLFQDVAA